MRSGRQALLAFRAMLSQVRGGDDLKRVLTELAKEQAFETFAAHDLVQSIVPDDFTHGDLRALYRWLAEAPIGEVS